MDWYAAKTLYRSRIVGAKRRGFAKALVEERVVLVRAPSEKIARRKAEREATRYARAGQYVNANGQHVVTEYLKHCDLYFMACVPEDGAEVYARVDLFARQTRRAALVSLFFGRKRESIRGFFVGVRRDGRHAARPGGRRARSEGGDPRA